MGLIKLPLKYIGLTDEKWDRVIEFLNDRAMTGSEDAQVLCREIYQQQNYNPADQQDFFDNSNVEALKKESDEHTALLKAVVDKNSKNL